MHGVLDFGVHISDVFKHVHPEVKMFQAWFSIPVRSEIAVIQMISLKLMLFE